MEYMRQQLEDLQAKHVAALQELQALQSSALRCAAASALARLSMGMLAQAGTPVKSQPWPQTSCLHCWWHSQKHDNLLQAALTQVLLLRREERVQQLASKALKRRALRHLVAAIQAYLRYKQRCKCAAAAPVVL